MKRSGAKRWHNTAVIALNLLCVLLIAWLFYYSNLQYRAKLHDQNINDIMNLNRAAATISSSIFSSRDQKLRDIVQYVQKSDLSLEETLTYIFQSTASGEGLLEVIRPDATGYLIQKDCTGSFVSLDYQSQSYRELQELFGGMLSRKAGTILYTPEFTDAYSGERSFALYTSFSLTDGTYTLMCVLSTDSFLENIRQMGGYSDLSTVLTDKNGNYLIGASGFESDNFYKDLSLFNGLSTEDEAEISAQVQNLGSGVLNFKNGKGEDCVYVYYHVSEGDWYSVSCVPISSFHNAAMDNSFAFSAILILTLMLAIDILWLNLLNRELKVSMRQEREANQAKTEFLSRMSHDMRTPLNAVLGFAAIAKEERDVPPEVSDSLDKIEQSGKYLLGLINDILDMAKIESGKMELHEELVDWRAFLKEISEMFSAEAALKGIRLETDFSRVQTPYVLMDPLRSKQIYANLLSNAIKFSESGTTVTWEIVDFPTGEDRFRMQCVIRDQGCGMEKQFLERLFEPFVQEQKDGYRENGGTGLGLSIVKKLVELMNGTIEVESEAGKGTTFTIVMDQKTKVPETLTAESENTVSYRVLEGKKILICEDHPLNSQIVVRLLSAKGVESVVAGNGKDGVTLFEKSEVGKIDAVLMDIRMPVMDGLTAARAIRELDRPDAKTIPIIAMTANAYDEDVRNSLGAGMNAHLAKPMDPKKLYETLVLFLGGKKRSERM